jgi:hypothetical protein
MTPCSMRSAGWVVSLLLTVVVVGSGCRQRDRKPELLDLEGRIESIKRESAQAGEITISYYSEKMRREMTGSGEVTPETQITIDGEPATLADLREGDRVRGRVQIAKQRDGKRATAVSIRVERPKPADPS